MSIDGFWKITVNSPMGRQETTLELKVEGNKLTGTQTGMGTSQPIKDGKVEGDALSWTSSLTNPMPVTLKFSGTVSGDTVTGKVKAGVFGAFDFVGSKA